MSEHSQPFQDAPGARATHSVSAQAPAEHEPSEAPSGGAAGDVAAARPVGILAGGGLLPLVVAQSIEQAGGCVHIAGLQGEADKAIEAHPHSWCYWGAIGCLLRNFRKAGCRELVIAGAVRRPDLSKVRPDLGFFRSLPAVLALMKGGDDSVLSKVVRFFEGEGFVVRGAHEFAPQLLAVSGAMGRVEPDERQNRAIQRGVSLLNALGPFDIGQAVLASADRIHAVEGAGGTDAMIRNAVETWLKATDTEGASAAGRKERAPSVTLRTSGVKDREEIPALPASKARQEVKESLRQFFPAAGVEPELPAQNTDMVLVKLPKPGQELRVDMPAIGPRTVELAETAGVGGLAVAAKQVLMLDRDRLIDLADRSGKFVAGIEVGGFAVRSAGPAPAQFSEERASATRLHLQTGARRRPKPQDWADIELGRRLLGVMAEHRVGDAVVISRGYVLAVQAVEPLERLLQIVGRRQPWGRLTSRRRGVLIMRVGRSCQNERREARDVNVEILNRVGKSSLAGIALVGDAALASMDDPAGVLGSRGSVGPGRGDGAFASRPASVTLDASLIAAAEAAKIFIVGPGLKR